MRVWVLILLLANVAMAGFVYLWETRVPPRSTGIDLNADKLRLLPLPQEKPPVSPAADNAARPGVSACVEWSSIPGNDLQRARDLMASLALPAERVVERRIEEPTSFWVQIPPTGDAAATVAKIRQAGLKDVSLQPNNTRSLGIFNTEESARRALGLVQAKGFNQARIEPRNRQFKTVALTVRESTADIVNRLGEFKDKIAGSSVRSVDCP